MDLRGAGVLIGGPGAPVPGEPINDEAEKFFQGIFSK